MLKVRIASRPSGWPRATRLPVAPVTSAPSGSQEDDPQLVLALGLRRRHEQADDEREVRMAEREGPARRCGVMPAAEHVELLARLRLGRVGEEGEVDLRHGCIVARAGRRGDCGGCPIRRGR